MSSSEVERVRDLIREAIVVTQFYDPPPQPLLGPDGKHPVVPLAELIVDAESRLGVAFPPWLRQVYESCNGFAGPFDECILYPLDTPEGVTEFTLFLREQKWAPPWMARAIVFGFVGGTGSLTTHTVALDGELVEWRY